MAALAGLALKVALRNTVAYIVPDYALRLYADVIVLGHLLQPPHRQDGEIGGSSRLDGDFAPLYAPVVLLLGLCLMPGLNATVSFLIHAVIEGLAQAFGCVDVLLPPVNILQARVPEVVLSLRNQSTHELKRESLDEATRLQNFIHSGVNLSEAYRLAPGGDDESLLLRNMREAANLNREPGRGASD